VSPRPWLITTNPDCSASLRGETVIVPDPSRSVTCVLLQLIARCCCRFEVELAVAAAAKVGERREVNADVL
jgi:hypothetical protein